LPIETLGAVARLYKDFKSSIGPHAFIMASSCQQLPTLLLNPPSDLPFKSLYRSLPVSKIFCRLKKPPRPNAVMLTSDMSLPSQDGSSGDVSISSSSDSLVF